VSWGIAEEVARAGEVSTVSKLDAVALPSMSGRPQRTDQGSPANPNADAMGT